MSRGDVVARRPVHFSPAVEILFDEVLSSRKSVTPAHGEIMADRKSLLLLSKGIGRMLTPKGTPTVPCPQQPGATECDTCRGCSSQTTQEFSQGLVKCTGEGRNRVEPRLGSAALNLDHSVFS